MDGFYITFLFAESWAEKVGLSILGLHVMRALWIWAGGPIENAQVQDPELCVTPLFVWA